MRTVALALLVVVLMSLGVAGFCEGNSIVDYGVIGSSVQTEITSALTANWVVITLLFAVLLALVVGPKVVKRFVK
jgi:uncharacterized membrane-anchored protein YitT (DUF2179 family)